jgi:hypothetical protein
MAKVTIVKALSGYFNVDTLDETKPGDAALIATGAKGKRRVGEWGAELKQLTDEEKTALAQEVVKITGDTL